MELFNVYPLNNIEISKAKGVYLWDKNGTKYLDMYGGHAVISIGHSSENYLSAIHKQLNEIAFYSNSVIIPQQRILADKLGKLSGKIDYNLFLCNSGAEANENAMKLASMHNGRKKVIAFSGSFHGRTSLAVAATDNRSIVAPVNESDNVVILPYNDELALECEFAKNEDVCCVIIEAIQGVGGVKMASHTFLQKIRLLCDKSGALLIADCVQCGCGRSGLYFSLDHSGVLADIYSIAKGIGNGFPIGAIMITPKIKASYGMLGTTFGGSYLACAAATAVADEIYTNQLMDNASEMGNYMIDKLSEMMDGGVVHEVRGIGLMIGLVLNKNSFEIRKRLLEQEHIFVGNAKDPNVLRILPPLNITKEECDLFLTAIKKYI